IRTFLEAALGCENVSEALARDLAAYSGGLPLLLREAADSLLEAQRLHYAGKLPPGLREALRLRLDRLETEPRRMIEAAAILGPSFLERVLQAVLGWASPSYAAALDTLLARRLLVNAQSTGQDDYAFSHRSIQEVILGEITEGRAAELHEAAARALEEIHGESMGHADEIARHYEAAGQTIQAASHWLRHAEDVTDVSAYGQALEIIAHAVELAVGNTTEKRELLAQAALQRAAIAHNQGQLDQVPTLLQEALSLCIDYPRLYCKALFFQAHVFFTGDHWQEGRQSASQAIALARASGDSLIEGRALHIRALCDMMLGRTAEAVEDLEAALSRLEGTGQTKSILYARNLNHLGTALTFMQAYPRAVQALEKAIAMAKAAGLKRLEALALAMLGQVALNRGRYAEAIENYSRSIEVLGGSYIPGLWGKYAGRGLAYLRSGDIQSARTDFERGLEIGLQIDSLYAKTLMQYYLACVALAQGDTPLDLPSLVEIEDAAAGGQIHAVVSQAGEVGGQGWRRLGELERAIQTHERSLRAAEATQVPLFILGVKIELLLDRLLLAASDELLGELDRLIEQVRGSGELPLLTRGLLAKADALLHDRRAAEALPFIEEGLSLAHACPDKPLIAEANYLLAAAQFQLGDSALARRALAQARSIAQESAWPMLIQIASLEAQTGKPAAKTTEYRKTLLKLLGDTTEKKAVTPSA
ncbi:MAG: ATP-binding protein, partial [Chloroflexota bacterium]